jgi:hypothetical protein
MAAAIYSTTVQEGVDINNVFYLDTKTYPEYPAPPFIAGELAWGTDGSEWVYCTASVTIGAGNVVLINGNPGSWSVAPITSATARLGFGQLIGVVGGSQGTLQVSQPTGTQTASFFWVQRAGNAPAVLDGTVATLFTQLATSTLSGGVGTAVSSTTAAVNGIVFSQTAATVGNKYPAVLNYPVVGSAS